MIKAFWAWLYEADTLLNRIVVAVLVLLLITVVIVSVFTLSVIIQAYAGYFCLAALFIAAGFKLHHDMKKEQSEEYKP